MLLFAGYHRELGRCQARDGWPCVFPFEYRDQVYHACATADHEDGKPWCSILNHPNGSVHKWQTCQQSQKCDGTFKALEFLDEEEKPLLKASLFCCFAPANKRGGELN